MFQLTLIFSVWNAASLQTLQKSNTYPLMPGQTVETLLPRAQLLIYRPVWNSLKAVFLFDRIFSPFSRAHFNIQYHPSVLASHHHHQSGFV